VPRPIWTGSISFGLVNVPVRLYPAVRPKEVHFHQLHDKDGARIALKRVCSAEGKEVPYEHIVKGFEVSKGRYVMVTKEELEAFAPQSSKQVEISDFVELAQIDPIFYDATYYLAPDKGATKAYALLLQAMRKTGKVGIGKMVMRTKEYLCAIRPKDEALALSTMQYADEVVSTKDLDDLPGKNVSVPPNQLKLAEQLVEQLAGPFKPEKYHDEYRERVIELLKKKAEGEEIVAPEEPERPAKTVDLIEALRRSLESSAARGGSHAANEDAEETRHRGEHRRKAEPHHRVAAKAARKPPARRRKRA
jgi:DNA end-binding protein Ku